MEKARESQPMQKVLFILNHPDNAINFYDDLFDQISNEFQLHILSVKCETSRILEEKGYHLHYYQLAVKNPFVLVLMIKSMYSVIRKIKPDLVVGSTLRNLLFGNLVSDFLGIPTISPILGIGPLFENNGLSYRFARLLYPYALKNTRHTFFFNTDDMRKFLAKKFITGQDFSRIKGYGVDLEKFKPITKKSSDHFTFLMISRLLYDKGIQEYVEAAKSLKSKYPKIKFQLIGGFWDKNLKKNTVSKEKMESWCNSGYIEYLGKIKDVRPYIAECDCIVHPSYREGLSNVLMEGGAMAKPLLSTNVPGCKELIIEGVNGFTFESKSTSSLIKAVEKILPLDKTKLIRMGLMSRELMSNNYNRRISTSIFLGKIKQILLFPSSDH